MKTLLILRHAKSSWAETESSDFDRPLNDRGRMTAPFMGSLIAREGPEPYVILSSPARRAKETAELVKKAGGFDAEIRYEPRFYEASLPTLRQVVSEIDDAYPSAMIIGHNPGLEGFLRYVTGNIEPLPTAGLAVVELNIDTWAAVNDRTGTLKKIVRPREEMADHA